MIVVLTEYVKSTAHTLRTLYKPVFSPLYLWIKIKVSTKCTGKGHDQEENLDLY